jgi:hypothetical protein
MSAYPRHNAQTSDALTSDARPLSISELFKFTALASSFAIFADAAIAHAMSWGNDPY